MIKKLIKKITPYLLIAIAFLGNTNWIPSVKIKDVKKEDLSKISDSTFSEVLQYKPAEEVVECDSEILSIKKPVSSLVFRNYDGQKIINEISQSSQATLLVNVNSSTSVMSVINFEYINSRNHTSIISEIKDISIDVAEPKIFLAKNLNEEWKKILIFILITLISQKKLI